MTHDTYILLKMNVNEMAILLLALFRTLAKFQSFVGIMPTIERDGIMKETQ